MRLHDARTVRLEGLRPRQRLVQHDEGALCEPSMCIRKYVGWDEGADLVPVCAGQQPPERLPKSHINARACTHTTHTLAGGCISRSINQSRLYITHALFGSSLQEACIAYSSARLSGSDAVISVPVRAGVWGYMQCNGETRAPTTVSTRSHAPSHIDVCLPCRKGSFIHSW